MLGDRTIKKIKSTVDIKFRVVVTSEKDTLRASRILALCSISEVGGVFFFKDLIVFIFGCIGSSLLCAGFLQLR